MVEFPAQFLHVFGGWWADLSCTGAGFQARVSVKEKKKVNCRRGDEYVY